MEEPTSLSSTTVPEAVPTTVDGNAEGNSASMLSSTEPLSASSSTTNTNLSTSSSSSSFLPKPKINKPNIRKRPRQRDTSDDENNDDDESSVPNIQKIKELMEDQKYRSFAKSGGINAEKTSWIEKQSSTKLTNNSSKDETNLSIDKQDKSIVDKAFANFDVGKTVSNDSTEDPLLLAYIEEKLQEEKRKKLHPAQPLVNQQSGTGNTTDHLSASSSSSLSSAQGLLPHDHVTAEDILNNPAKLYELPQHLQKSSSSHLSSTSSSSASTKSLLSSLGLSAITTRSENGDVGTGGVILGGTGIAEVILPESYKVKNMEETERMKELILAKKRRSTTIYQQDHHHHHHGNESIAATVDPVGTPSTLPPGMDTGSTAYPHHRSIMGSYTANYSQHRKDYAVSMKEHEQIVRQQRYNNNNNNNTRDPSSTANHPESSHSHPSSHHHQPHRHHPRHHRPPVSNDDTLFNKFKKQEIASLRNR